MTTENPLGDALARLERVGRGLRRLGADLARLDEARMAGRLAEIERMSIAEIDLECARHDAKRLGLPEPISSADVARIETAARRAARR